MRTCEHAAKVSYLSYEFINCKLILYYASLVLLFWLQNVMSKFYIICPVHLSFSEQVPRQHIWHDSNISAGYDAHSGLWSLASAVIYSQQTELTLLSTFLNLPFPFYPTLP